MARNINFAPGEFYHIYNRGTDLRTIFLDEHDYKRFLVLMYLCNGGSSIDLREHFSAGKTFSDLFSLKRGEKLVDIGAYCLMPNHLHLLMFESVDNGISLFMQKLSTGYTMYFNKKHKRSGSLFQGRFKAQHADNDVYLKYLFSYIHLNPVKLVEPEWKEKGVSDVEKIKKYLEEYPYSSYHEFMGKKRFETKILNQSVFPEYFETKVLFESCLDDWITYSQEQATKVQPSLYEGYEG